MFYRERAVYARPFDVKTLTLSGEEHRVADEVTADVSMARGHFSASLGGAVVYFQNAGATIIGGRQSELAEWHLAWASRSGQLIEHAGPARRLQRRRGVARHQAHRGASS